MLNNPLHANLHANLHALGRPQGETPPVWPPRPSRKRRLLLRSRHKEALKSLSELLSN